jgi:hypothetical protein
LLLALISQRLLRSLDTLLVEVGAVGSSAKDDEAMHVATCPGDGSKTLLGYTHEVVLRSSSTNGIDSDAQVAIRAVLESHREGKAGGQLTVQLGFGGSGANGTYGDTVGQELRRDGVEHFTGDGHAARGEVDEHLSRNTKTLVDLERRVDIGVINQTLPANSSTGLLQVSSHNDAKVVRQCVCELLQTSRVLQSSLGVMDGTRPNDNEKTVTVASDDLSSLDTPLDDSLDSIFRKRDLACE